MVALAVTLVVAFGAPDAAGAATFTVNLTTSATDLNPGDGVCDSSATAGSQCTLAAAIQEANALAGADTITFIVTSVGGDISYDVSDDLTIEGNGIGATSIAGRIRSDVADATTPVSLTIEDLELDGVSVAGDGGAIWSDGDLTLRRVRILGGSANQANVGTGGGGGVYQREDTLVVEECEFQNNVARMNATGGAILLADGADATIIGSTFTSNQAGVGGTGGNGGAIAQLNGHGVVTIDDSTFSLNEAIEGGALIGEYTITNSMFTRNSALSGGAYRCSSAITTITGSQFIGNRAFNSAASGPRGGGAIRAIACGLTIERSVFNGNTTGQPSVDAADGGALLLGNGMTRISRSELVGNVAADDGAGIVIEGFLASLEVVATSFDGNRATGRGGGIYHLGGVLSIHRATFTGNVAGEFDLASGGGIYSEGTFTLEDSLLFGNTSNFPSGDQQPDDILCNSGTGVTNGFNLLGDATCDFIGSTSGHIVGVDPMLSARRVDAGGVGYRAPAFGGAAIDAGDSSACLDADGAEILTDQRGLLSPLDADGDDTARCDLGAIEIGQNGVIVASEATRTVGEGVGTAQIEFRRIAGTNGAISVSYGVTDGSATTPGDYSDSGIGSLSWADGVGGTQSVPVAIVDDGDLEGNEDFSVSAVFTTGGALLGAPDTTVVTIADNEIAQPGELAFTSATYAVSEAGGSLLITVERTGGTDGAVTVAYGTADDTASEPSDYGAASGTLSWGDGETGTRSFSVAVVDDTDFEGDEQFALSLSSPTGGAALGISAATVTIQDDDPAQRGTVSMDVATASVSESGGSISISATRAGGSDGAVSVQMTFGGGSATEGAGNDYVASAATLSWVDGETGTKSASATILDDSELEGNEDFVATLGGATGGVAIGSANTTTVTILDDESPDPGTVSFVASASAAAESAGSATVAVQRTGGTNGAVSVRVVSANVSATAGQDYAAVDVNVAFADGESGTKDVTLTITDDAADELDETFTLTLSTGDATVGTPSVHTFTINDDDEPAPMDAGVGGDAGVTVDAGAPMDAGMMDGGVGTGTDAGTIADAGAADGGDEADAGDDGATPNPDAGGGDAGLVVAPPPTEGSTCTAAPGAAGGTAGIVWFVLAAFGFLRRRSYGR